MSQFENVCFFEEDKTVGSYHKQKISNWWNLLGSLDIQRAI